MLNPAGIELRNLGWDWQWCTLAAPENRIAAKSNYWCLEIANEDPNNRIVFVFVVWPEAGNVSVEVHSDAGAHLPYADLQRILSLGHELFQQQMQSQDELT
ncbi:MAG: hypothetical protein ACRCWF_12520 [Beijerinckiaceae bacterium]